MNFRYLSCVILVMCIAIPVDMLVLKKFMENQPSSYLLSFVLNRKSHALYVGSSTRIYALSEDLNPIGFHNIRWPNKSNCSSEKSDCTANCNQTACDSDSSSISGVFSQALALNSDNAVIFCSSAYLGSCERIGLDLVPLNEVFKSIVSHKTDSRILLVISESASKVYVGTTHSVEHDGQYENSTSFLSLRHITNFSLVHNISASSNRSTLDILQRLRRTFPISFIGGFEYEGFMYFVIVHRESVSNGSQMRTFMLRICNRDDTLRSLIEIRLDCIIRGVPYYIAQDISLIKGSGGGNKTNTGVLFAAFSDHSEFKDTKNSAVCSYSMDDIDKTFYRALEHCFDGQGNIGPEYVVNVLPCVRHPPVYNINLDHF